MKVLGVGIDLVDVSRIERMLERKGERVVAKLLTAREREYVATQHFPARAIAARIAAKEAAYKAFQCLPEARGVGWQDLEVLRHVDGRPALRLHGEAARLAERHGPLEIQLSLSHSETTAGAIALLGKVE